MIVDCPGCQARYDVSGRPPNTKARCRCGTTFTMPEPPEDAGGLNCPGCGGSAGPTDTQCGYCNSPLALARCPRCFGSVFAGNKHCGHCGTKTEAPAKRHVDQATEQRPCPRCKDKSQLVGLLAGEVLVDHCERCGGLWLDHAVFETMQEKEEMAAPAMLSLAQLSKPTSEAVPHGYIPCPDCEKLMNPGNFARRSGIIIDTCKAHGVWFDAGELPQIVAFIRSGGLEQSRVRDKEDLEAEKRKARLDATFAAQQDARYAGRHDPWGTTGSSVGVDLASVVLRRLFGIW